LIYLHDAAPCTPRRRSTPPSTSNAVCLPSSRPHTLRERLLAVHLIRIRSLPPADSFDVGDRCALDRKHYPLRAVSISIPIPVVHRCVLVFLGDTVSCYSVLLAAALLRDDPCLDALLQRTLQSSITGQLARIHELADCHLADWTSRGCHRRGTYCLNCTIRLCGHYNTTNRITSRNICLGIDTQEHINKWLKKRKLEMWANAQRDGRPAEYRWRPLFNAAKFG